MASDEITLAGRYQLKEQIGSGATARLFQAADLGSGAQVAVKVLRQEFTDRPHFRRWFLSEAQALAKLRHPNLVTLVDFGVEAKQCYIVLEWVEGTDLKKLLRQRGPLAIDESLRIAQQISEGLSHVHKAGLVHCDVKPQNVLLTSSGRAKLADFGVARLLSDKHRRPPEIAWATPQYFSPEQAAGENPSPASDVYSLGVVLFEMLSGRLPFPGQDPRTLAVEHLRHAPSPLQTLVPDVPVSVRSLVERMLEKDPRDRYRDGGEAAAALGQLSAELGYALLPLPASPSPGQASPSAAQEPEAADRREGGIDWKAVALGFVALVAVGGLVPLWVWVYLAYHPLFP